LPVTKKLDSNLSYNKVDRNPTGPALRTPVHNVIVSRLRTGQAEDIAP
jgi:hypothetical protein